MPNNEQPSPYSASLPRVEIPDPFPAPATYYRDRDGVMRRTSKAATPGERDLAVLAEYAGARKPGTTARIDVLVALHRIADETLQLLATAGAPSDPTALAAYVDLARQRLQAVALAAPFVGAP